MQAYLIMIVSHERREVEALSQNLQLRVGEAGLCLKLEPCSKLTLAQYRLNTTRATDERASSVMAFLQQGLLLIKELLQAVHVHLQDSKDMEAATTQWKLSASSTQREALEQQKIQVETARCSWFGGLPSDDWLR